MMGECLIYVSHVSQLVKIVHMGSETQGSPGTSRVCVPIMLMDLECEFIYMNRSIVAGPSKII